MAGTREQLEKTRQPFTTETARAAQVKSVEARNANKILADALAFELRKQYKRTKSTKGEKIITTLVDSATEGDLQSQKLLLDYAQKNAPKQARFEQDENGQYKLIIETQGVEDLTTGL